MVMSIKACEGSAKKLGDKKVKIADKLAIVNELRESIEIVQSQDYQKYLSTILPAFLQLLSDITPVFTPELPEHKIRLTVIEIIHRFPQNELLKPYASDLMQAFLTILRTDNEEVSVVTLKIITDLHKNYKNVLEEHVQPFLDIVKEMFGNMESAINENFGEESASSPPFHNIPSSGSHLTTTEDQPSTKKQLSKSLFSFRVLTDCPIIIALLFQLHRRFVTANVPDLVPCVISALSMQPKQQLQAHQEAVGRDDLFIGISPYIRNRAAYAELKSLQVKTVSFLAYILRSYVQAFQPYCDEIAASVVGLMRDVPSEASATRKELLVATRHIWQTEFRNSFVRHIDVLLNENVMTGSGLTCRETLRPLAHSVLVDLIHHIRNELTMEQLSRIVYIYSRYLHDTSFAPNIQTMCVKLLLNVVECILKWSSENEEARRLLVRILETFANKLYSLSLGFPIICKIYHKKLARSKSGNATLSTDAPGTPLGQHVDHALDADLDLTAVPEYEGYIDLGFSQPIRTSIKPLDSTPDIIKDIRFLLKYIIPGIKNVIFSIGKCNPPVPPNVDSELWFSVARGFSNDELEIFVKISKYGLRCFDYFNLDLFDSEGEPIKPKEKETSLSPTVLTVASKDEKEALEGFASIFMVIEPSIFQEVFSSQIPSFMERAMINNQLLAVPQYFLATGNLSPHFAGLLIRYLVDNLERLGGPDLAYANVMSKLFKLLFMAVTIFPDKNEAVLRTHLGNLIMSCMKYSHKSKEPFNYFILLRALFRAISGGRFESLYQEVLPILPTLLEGLNQLLATAQHQNMKELFVELCLTVPVRLSVLLPFLNLLMKPLVIALHAGPELVSQALRTLELCIDNLTHDFLEPIITPVSKELFTILWKHLKPEPYNTGISNAAIRILGKIGGHNRLLLKHPPTLSYNKKKETRLSAYFCIEPIIDEAKPLNLDSALDSCIKVLKAGTADKFYLEQALIFLKGCLPLLIDVEAGSNELGNVISASVIDYVENKGTLNDRVGNIVIDELNPFDTVESDDSTKLEAHTALLSQVVAGLFYANNISSIKQEAGNLLDNIIRHFALLDASNMIHLSKQGKSCQAWKKNIVAGIITTPFSKLDGFIDGIVEVLSSENQQLQNLASDCLEKFYQTCYTLLSSKEAVEDIPLFRILASKFCSACYHSEWYKKSGGCVGILLLSKKIDLGSKWILEHELDFVKALLFVLKDTAMEMISASIDGAANTLSHILKICNTNNQTETRVEVINERRIKFNSLVSSLISELSNTNVLVRETIQSFFSLLSELTGNDVATLLNPVRDRLLSPIFAKPLRALPFPMQIGHIDAITYCISLQPPLFTTFTEELIRFLQEALAMADAEDQALIVGKGSPYRNMLSLSSLRVACLKLLSAALSTLEFGGSKLSAMKTRIISVFFKLLYSKSPEVVESANDGLKLVLSTPQHRLPKDLLQAGLRPILMNLSDAKKLTVASLEGLARLLQLLTNYFKVEIGRKLLDHLKTWADPEILEMAASRPLKEVNEIKIIAAILNVFHLLPAAANCFLEEIILQILDLEKALRRYRSSPFTEPLINYLNRYSEEAVEYFYKHIASSSSHNKLLLRLLSEEAAEPLRLAIIQKSDMFVETHFTDLDNSENIEYKLQGTRVIKELCEYHPDWFLHTPALIESLKKIWSIELPLRKLNTSNFDVNQVLLQNILELFMVYCSRKPTEVDLLFEMIYALDLDISIEQDGLKKFIYEVCINYPSSLKKIILESFLRLYADSNIKQQSKALIIRMLIVPMLTISHSKGDFFEVVDEKIVISLDNVIWLPYSLENAIANVEMTLVVELFQLTALLIQCGPTILSDNRKNIIKFAWNYNKIEDITCKQAAYVVLARFVAEYATPSNIIIQIFVALIRTHQPEVRTLVRQALDILLPIMPDRVPSTGTAGSTVSTWVRWSRRVIVEDGHTSTQLVTIYQLITRHPDLFFERKDAFVPQIISSLSRLGLSPTSTKETKNLTVELAELIFDWEKQGLAIAASADAMETDIATGSSEMLISYLIRFYTSLIDPAYKKELGSRAFSILREFLNIWPNVSIKLALFEKASALDINESNINTIENSLELMELILTCKGGDWILDNLLQLQKSLEPWIYSTNHKVAKFMGPVISKLFTTISLFPAHENNALFIKCCDDVIKAGLHESNNVFMTISLVVNSYGKRSATDISPIMSDLMKMFQKVCKEHVAENSVYMDSGEMIIQLLSLLRTRTPVVAEQKKWFISSLNTLIEKSQDVSVLKLILEILSGWIRQRTESFPSAKEKANLMVKMMDFEHRKDKSLLESYLELVASIYADPSLLKTDLAVRLESAFLLGLKNNNPIVRKRFSDLLNQSIPNNAKYRLNYIFGMQNWDYLSDTFWIKNALDLLLGCFVPNSLVYLDNEPSHRLQSLASLYDDVAEYDQMEIEEKVPELISVHQDFLLELQHIQATSIIQPMTHLIYLDPVLAYHLWVQFFPLCWETLNPKEQHDLNKSIIPMLSKQYHLKQASSKPNVIQCLLEGFSKSLPPLQLPPQLVKYLSKTYNSWYTGLELLQTSEMHLKAGGSTSKEEEKIRDSNLDALAGLYDNLSEDDFFVGLWRRRCCFAETNSALSFEQAGMWSIAQNLYEQAQTKARTGVLAFSEAEYNLWEDHWMKCAQSLQQWDILTDLSKSEGNYDQLIECVWRSADWVTDSQLIQNTLNNTSDLNIPRKKIFEVFQLWNTLQDGIDRSVEFQKAIDDGMHSCLKKWVTLPEIVSSAHTPLLHYFQQFIEFQEAAQIQSNLMTTNTMNVDTKSSELKGILNLWRDRVPSSWDSIDHWSDLVAWRQHVFGVINKAYLPLLHANGNPAPGQSPPSSHAYRGYHETAWIINRFAHVARVHKLNDVCINQLTKIYTLPNIEIHEAFYKLREQAKCYLMSPGEYASGLDVVNNTNLMYFNPQQKAEFWALKGMFFDKLNLHEDTVSAFSSATQIDANLPRAWANWGHYYDRLHKEASTDQESDSKKHAASAVNCYMQAASLFNKGKSRKYLARVLWLVSFDDDSGIILKAYENFKGEQPLWYWISFIPQLLTALSGKESKMARNVLMKIAKLFPQALHFHLRTLREDLAPTKKADRLSQAKEESTKVASSSESITRSGASKTDDAMETDEAAETNEEDAMDEDDKRASGSLDPAVSAVILQEVPVQPEERKPAWVYVDELTSLVKTAFPLLAMSMETMIEQIINKLKPTTDEDIYRLIVALLNDGVQQLARDPVDSGPLSPATETNLCRFAESMSPNHLKYKAAFEWDFIKSKPTLTQLIERFRNWRTKLEIILDTRPKKQRLEFFSHYLIEFQYSKFDEIEIPGQYNHLIDSKLAHKNFVTIERFMPEIELVRTHGSCFRRITMRGNDGNLYNFSVQHPAFRQARREEKIIQLMRILNSILDKKKETRKRKLGFHLPTITPLSPQARLVEDDSSYTSLQQVLEDHCAGIGIQKDDSIAFFLKRMKEVMLTEDMGSRSKVDMLNLKTEIMEEVSNKMIPDFVLSKYMADNMSSPADLWLMRKQFINQMASVTFMTYVFCIGQRYPYKFLISKSTGKIFATELAPNLSSNSMIFSNQEAVPFRFTPNIQHFMTSIGIEGVFTSSLMSIGNALTDPENDFEDYLSVFVRDEIVSWQSQSKKPGVPLETNMKELVATNVDVLVRKTQAVSCQSERDREKREKDSTVPANQTILDLISQASNPLKLAQMDICFIPQF